MKSNVDSRMFLNILYYVFIKEFEKNARLLNVISLNIANTKS